MANTTIGLDIGARAIRYVVCSTEAQKTEIRAFGSVPAHAISDTDTALDWDVAYDAMVEIMAPYRKTALDGIGLCVDPTRALTLHKIMPFNDPRILAQVLPQALSDTWNIDEDTQLAFEVGEFLKGVQTDSDEEASSDGYDIHVVKYPKNVLRSGLERLKAHQIDPHVVMTTNDAVGVALRTLVEVPAESAWCILDIGANQTELFICQGGSILASRAFKVGGSTIDAAIAQAFGVSEDDARQIKENTAFLAVPGTELQVYNALLNEGRIQPWSIDTVQLAQVTAQAMTMLLSGIRQMMMQSVRKLHIEPTNICLTGGGSNLCGLESWLSQYFGVECHCGLPFKSFVANGHRLSDLSSISIGAAAVAVCAQKNIDGKCPLNLRRGDLAHKGSLAVIQEKKWVLAALVMLVLIAMVGMTVTKAKSVQAEHDRMRTALENATQEVFGKKLLNYRQIEAEIADSQGFSFIPERTAFTHFAWISSQVNDNLSDVEMDLNSLDIDTQRKIVTIRGEVSGDDGLPKFMQLLEQYECFPNEIQEPKTSKTRDRVAFTLRVEATQCASGGDGD